MTQFAVSEIPERHYGLDDAIVAMEDHHAYLATRKYLTEQDKRLLAAMPDIIVSMRNAWTSFWYGGGGCGGAIG